MGRLKLLKLHLEEYVDSVDDPPTELKEYLEFLDAEVNQEIGEEWQNISVESTFSSKSARDMAKDVGMEQEYKLLFAPASSATHGEWSSLDRTVLVRCQNPLHRRHRIPRETLTTPIGSEFMDTIHALVEELVLDYQAAITSRKTRENSSQST